MTLLEEIQNAAIDSSGDLGTLLRKCKVLAARIAVKPLEEWLIWESNGYPPEVVLPEYRVWLLFLKGHFSGPFGSGLTNAPIPSSSLPERAKKTLSQYECRQSVSTIETLLRETKVNYMQVSTGDLAPFLGMRVYDGMNCIHAWGEFTNSHLIELLNSVRNRILDFALALEKEQPHAGERVDGSAKGIDAQRVTQIFNTTVYGSAQMVGTASHSNVSMTVHANNFPSLETRLRQNGVSDADIADLRAAVSEEPGISANGGFGPKVSSWIGKMIRKAAEDIWKIGVAAAGTLLDASLKQYYGLQ